MRTAKLFKNGQSQAVRLPKEFRFDGSKVYIAHLGSAVVLLPEKDTWKTLHEACQEFTDDFMETREQPATQTRETL